MESANSTPRIALGTPLIHIVDESTGQDLIKYVPLQHQLDYHYSDHVPNLLMYGGRGSGKSHCMRMDAHWRAISFPGFTYLILRRKMPDLLRTHLIHLDREMARLGGYYNKTEKISYYSNGSKGFFGHCESEADVDNYLSNQYDLVVFDEVSTFELPLVLNISAAARTTEDKPYRALVRGGTNPKGIGAKWVQAWFINKDVNQDEYQYYNPSEYQIIFSTYLDNPHLDQADYVKRLGAQDSHTRKAWLLGEYSEAGAYFDDFQPWRTEIDGEPREPYEWHVINRLPEVKGKSLLEQPWINIYRTVDYGFSPDPAVCLWIAVLPNKQAIVFKERTYYKTTAQDVAQDIARESERMRVIETFADPSMWIEGRRQVGISTADTYEANGVPLTQSKNDRQAIGHAIHGYLNTIIDGAPKLQIYREGCPQLINTFPMMLADKNTPERIADGPDHHVIALGYFCMGDIAASREPRKLSDIPRWKRNPTSNKYTNFRI